MKEGLTYYYYIFNLFVIMVILYRIFIGRIGGLFNESSNLAAFMFSSGLSIAFFETAGNLINNYLCPNIAISLVIGLWLIFILTYASLWILKARLMGKVFQSARERRVVFPEAVDKLGGMVCGLVLGVLILSFLMLSIYVAPIPENVYEMARFKEGVIFRVDEFLPRVHGAVSQILPPEARFDWESFLSKYKEDDEEDAQKDKEKKKDRRTEWRQ